MWVVEISPCHYFQSHLHTTSTNLPSILESELKSGSILAVILENPCLLLTRPFLSGKAHLYR